MNETITVDEALSKGQKMVNYPVIVIILGVTGLAIYLFSQKIAPLWAIPVAIVLGIALGWIWWSFMIVKWRLWAFEHVRNVHELKQRAVEERLIWPDDSVFEKTEIRSASDKAQWTSLQMKFEKDDLFEDDLSIPNETIICYSKANTLFAAVIMMGCFGFGLYMIITTQSYISGSVLSIIGLFTGYSYFKKNANSAPQIILNDKGIQTVSTAFYEWSQIQNERVISKGFGKYSRNHLVYDHPDGEEQLEITDFDTDIKKLNKLLRIYRGRHKRKTKVI